VLARGRHHLGQSLVAETPMSLFDGILDTPTPDRQMGDRGPARIRTDSSESESRTAVAKVPRESRPKLPRTPLDAIEQGIVRKLQANVSFSPGHSHKRFIGDLHPEKAQFSDRGRAYLAYIAHRYRRQWKATHEESCWIVRWASYGTLPQPKPESQCR
jgi:hypothetical protein